MAGLVLSPGPSSWLLPLLLLLSAGGPVPVAKTENLVSRPSGSACSGVWQNPRFVAKKRGSAVVVSCYMDSPNGTVSWLRKREMDWEPQPMAVEPSNLAHKGIHWVTILNLTDIQFKDNGIYFCQKKCSGAVHRGCGTELRVMGFSSLEQLKRRNTLKDGIIMVQTLLICLFITVPIFLLLDKDDSKAGMEDDHTYEGLDIDQTATYEDIVTLRTGEVKWSVGEHPGQE